MPQFPERITCGKSVGRRPIFAYTFVSGQRDSILVFGGFHGDEPKSVTIAHKLGVALAGDDAAREGCDWIIVPMVNPDGYEIRSRRNARKVDINRNFPASNWELGNPRSRMFGGPKPASEPETRCVIDVIERFAPSLIITIHSISGGRFCNNFDGPAKRHAERMSRHNKYPVTSSIGYPTPGSFGTWAGIERGIPTVTLELPTEHSLKRCWEDNRLALLRSR